MVARGNLIARPLRGLAGPKNFMLQLCHVVLGPERVGRPAHGQRAPGGGPARCNLDHTMLDLHTTRYDYYS